MKNNIFLIGILFFLINTAGFAQQWTEPVTITDMEGSDYAADFTVDNNGVIHCVWVNNPDYWNKWVYYSYSEDDGQTWSEAETVSEMDSVWRTDLHIVNDSKNNLYLSYIHNYRSVYESVVLMHKRENGYWSKGDTISGNYYGILRNQLAIDHNNRLYLLFSWGYETYMSYCDNGQWSDLVKITESSQDQIYINDAVVDNENMLHCLFAGVPYGSMDECYALYKKFDGQEWGKKEKCGGSMKNYYVKWGIDTDKNNQPHITYWECDPSQVGIPLDTTIYRYRTTDEGWSLPEIVVTDPRDMQIVLDQNDRPHVFDLEKTDEGNMLVHHFKYEGEWEGIVLAETHQGGVVYAVGHYKNQLYAIHTSDINPHETTDLEFTKTDITIGTGHEIEIPSFDLKLFPNPFAHKLHIKFEINNPGSLNVSVYDYSGKLIKTLLNTEGEAGKYEIVWDGTGQNRQRQSGGAYLLRLRCGKRILSKGIQLINP